MQQGAKDRIRSGISSIHKTPNRTISTKFHENHIAHTRFNSISLYNLVHKFIPMSKVAKIPDAKAAVEKEWNK